MAKYAFESDRKLRLGLWGLGRGLSFFEAAASCNIEVVAGCDYNAHMRERFQQLAPDAFVTDDDEAFLEGDFDAVLLATFCPSHAADAIRCLEAGKHVLSEVTAFHTMAEGVALVEAVERSGLVYNLAENYPYSAAHMYLARKWREGLFGQLMYAEGEYVHEVRTLAYTYIDGKPVEPGWALHHWRSWLNFHYYNTHSLGPVMRVTQTRPTSVVSLPGDVSLPGFPPVKGGGMCHVAPSLIRMDNGGLVKNLMGGTTNDAHLFRYWGDRGAAEISDGLYLRLGGGGNSPKHLVDPDWGELTPLAESMGHGGGDFFVLYYFARHCLLGEPAFFDVYRSADVTIPGILAYRSAVENGKPYDVPDFRQRAPRDAWRADHFAQPRYDAATGPWPKRGDRERLAQANTIIRDLVIHAQTYRAWADWSQVAGDMRDPGPVADMATRVIDAYPSLVATVQAARDLAEAHPRSDGAVIIRDMLEVIDADQVTRPDFLDQVKKNRTAIRRKIGRQA